MAGDGPFCRLTVLAPRARVDVALPSDVPVAELVPMVLELVGEPLPGRAAPPGRPLPWRLSGAAGGPLHAGATLDELGVLDGELLRIAPAGAGPPAPVFDDPVDALAASAGAGSAGDHRFSAAVVLVLATAAAGVLTTVAPGPVGATVAAAGALGAIIRSAALVRRGASGPEPSRAPARELARSCAYAAVPLAAAAGWAAGGLLATVVAAGVAAAVAQVVLRVVAPVLVGAVVAAVPAAGAAVALRFGITPMVAAAVATAAAIAVVPALPRTALRLAGLPRPVVPTGGDDLVDADSGPDLLPPGELAERADLGRGYLAGLVGGCAAVAAAGAAVVAGGAGWSGPALAGVTITVLGLRSRGYADRTPARASTVAAVGAAIALAALVAVRDDALARPLAGGALLLLAVAGAAVLGSGRAPLSPVARRALDWLEALLVASAVPLAFAVMDLYRLVHLP